MDILPKTKIAKIRFLLLLVTAIWVVGNFAIKPVFSYMEYDPNEFELDDEKIYCSELVYKSFKDATQENLGKLIKLKELNWESHREFIESIEVNGIPYEREMITPRDLSEASQLEKIYSNGM